jgi:AraC-like DNA-binding protein
MDCIPLHDFSRDDHFSIPFQIKRLKATPDYDPGLPHRHNFYQIFYFEKGGGSMEIDYESIDIQGHSIYFISPGQIHQLNPSGNANGYVIYFSREFYSLSPIDNENLLDLPYLNNNVSLPFINLEDDEFELHQLCKWMYKEFNKKEKNSKPTLWSYLYLILLRSKEYYKPVLAEKRSFYKATGVLLKFKRLIEEDFKTKQSVQDYVASLNVSADLLNDECKSILGKNASELISDRLVLEAKRLLIYSELSNKEIAFFLSFNDPSYFSRFFKKKTGSTPKDFRKILVKRYQ